MSTNGHKWGDPGAVSSIAIATATVIEIGDLVYEDDSASDVIEPAGDMTWDTDLATSQENFHDEFMGVALERSASGETNPIRIATTGVFKFDCASATFKQGTLVGPAKQSGNLLEPQKVVAVATANLAIGRVEESVTAAATKVHVRIFSTVMLGGPQAAA